MHTDDTIYTLAEYDCGEGHEWYGLCYLSNGTAVPIDQTEFCPVCGELNALDAEAEALPDFIPEDERLAHALKWEVRGDFLWPVKWYGTNPDYRAQPRFN